MKNLFDRWKEKTPKYDIIFKELLFEKITQKGGGSEQSREEKGKQFANNYELYIYAFFLGLYRNLNLPIPESSKKVDFNHAIQNWGSKGNRLDRKDFTTLQENIFIALISETDIDFIALEKGDVEEEDVVKSLIRTMESFTNGGLQLIKEKIEDNPNYFLQPTSFLDMILKSTD
jgi:hypothetical protein